MQATEELGQMVGLKHACETLHTNRSAIYRRRDRQAGQHSAGCKFRIDTDHCFHMSLCPLCGFDFGRSRQQFSFRVLGILIGLIWIMPLIWMLFAHRSPTVEDMSLLFGITIALALFGAGEYLKERLLRKRERLGVSLYLVNAKGIVRFWRRQVWARVPTSVESMYDTLVARAGGTAQRWLANNDVDVPEKFKWAETNLPEACLFARAESALLEMVRSRAELHSFVYGELPGTHEIAERHANSLFELADLHRAMLDCLRTVPSSNEIGEDLKTLSKQIEALLKYVNLMYA